MTEPTRAKPPSTNDQTPPEQAASSLTGRLLDDQRARWERGERFLVETYRDQHPDLATNTDAILDLIYQEILLRKQIGEEPPLAEYQERFPALAGPLRELFEVDDALAAGPLLDIAATQDVPGVGPDAEGRPAPTTELPSVPGYDILGELGRGRWAVVYRARQQQLNRVVALKMILAGAHAGPQELARFHTEASAVARFQHPNIVQIYQKGQHAGLPYLELEYVDGGSLEQHLAGTPQPAERAARLAEMLARAVHYAHQCGIVHRDLKPANVLLTTDGVPKIADFGLAKLPVGEEADKTRTGDIAGSPGYMAPEQAEGRTKEAGPAADVYGLGAILYDLVTGRPPFKAETWLETVRQVVAEEPVPPRRLRPKLPRDLETITLKCLQKQPPKRYASAAELADDLRRFQAGEPIRARPVSPWERGGRWARRRPMLTALVGVSGLAVLGLLALLTALWHNAEERAGFVSQLTTVQDQLEERKGQLAVLEQAAAAAEQRRHAAQLEMRRALYIRDLHLAQVALNSHHIKRLVQLLERQQPPPGQEDVRGFEWHYLWRLCHRERFLLRGHKSFVRAVVADPEGRTVVSLDNDGVLKQWEAATGNEFRTLPDRVGHVDALAFSPDGQLAATGHADGTVRLWERATGRVQLTIAAHDGAVLALAFAPDGRQLATGSTDRTAKLWDVATGRRLALFRGHRHAIHKIVFAPNGRRLATTGEEPAAMLWDIATEKGTPVKGQDNAWIQAVAFTPDSQALITGEAYPFSSSKKGALQVRDLETGKERHRVLVPAGGVFAVALSPDGRLLAWGENSGILTLYDTATWQMREQFYGHIMRVHSLVFTPDGKTLASCGNDMTVRLWDVFPKPARTTFSMPGRWATSVAFAPDGKSLAAGGDGRVIKWWDVAAGQEKATFQGHAKAIKSLAFAPHGRVLASGGADGTVRLWDLSTGKELAILRGRTGAAAFAPDGRTLASGALDHSVRLWDVAAKVERARLTGHQDAVQAVAFAPDGRTLASADAFQVRLWDAATGQPGASLPQPGGNYMALAFSPDSRVLAAGVWHDGAVELWDVATTKRLAVLRGHTEAVVSVIFTPDGQSVVSGSVDGTVKFWDRVTYLERFTLRGHTSTVNGLAFTSDGTMLATAGSDGTVRLWDATPDRKRER